MLNKSDIFPEIRVLPMDKSSEFNNWSIKEVQIKFFVQDLYNRTNCEFQYKNSSIVTLPGSLILFQYDNFIVALAAIDNVSSSNLKYSSNYKGAYYFKKDTIAIFDPISKSEMRNVWTSFKTFNQSKQYLDINQYQNFWDLLQKKNIKYAENLLIKSTFAISPTDIDWFSFLAGKNFTQEINFWTPSPWNISRLKKGDRFYFMLKSPIRKLGGYGLFNSYCNKTIDSAWNEYGYRNGCNSKSELVERLKKYSKNNINPTNYKIGCVELSDCVFWDEGDFKLPDDYGISFSINIVKLKYFDAYDSFTFEDDHCPVINKIDSFSCISPNTAKSKKQVLVSQRTGQSSFKSKISSIYQNKCCITSETCPELLEAAHIQPYIDKSSNHAQNGLLLRVDFHTLFDNNLLYIDDDYKIHISSLISNPEYKQYNGKNIRLPNSSNVYPSKSALKIRESEFRK